MHGAAAVSPAAAAVLSLGVCIVHSGNLFYMNDYGFTAPLGFVWLSYGCGLVGVLLSVTPCASDTTDHSKCVVHNNEWLLQQKYFIIHILVLICLETVRDCASCMHQNAAGRAVVDNNQQCQ